jgi:hypothetical protein
VFGVGSRASLVESPVLEFEIYYGVVAGPTLFICMAMACNTIVKI